MDTLNSVVYLVCDLQSCNQLLAMKIIILATLPRRWSVGCLGLMGPVVSGHQFLSEYLTLLNQYTALGHEWFEFRGKVIYLNSNVSLGAPRNSITHQSLDYGIFIVNLKENYVFSILLMEDRIPYPFVQ